MTYFTLCTICMMSVNGSHGERIREYVANLSKNSKPNDYKALKSCKFPKTCTYSETDNHVLPCDEVQYHTSFILILTSLIGEEFCSLFPDDAIADWQS